MRIAKEMLDYFITKIKKQQYDEEYDIVANNIIKTLNDTIKYYQEFDNSIAVNEFIEMVKAYVNENMSGEVAKRIRTTRFDNVHEVVYYVYVS